MSQQPDLFGGQDILPAGFRYQADLVTADEETALVREFATLPFREFEFHGHLGKRRVVSFGWKYDYGRRALEQVDDLPAFLLPLRAVAARFAERAPADLQQALVTEYAAGAGIGWHRDKGMFGDVIGISLVSACTFRLRRKVGTKWERVSIEAAPRSIYLMRGPSRTEWEHSIPPVGALRYSVTFRNFRDAS